MESCYDIKKIKEIEFIKKKSKISLKDIIETLYSPLDELAKNNCKTAMKYKNRIDIDTRWYNEQAKKSLEDAMIEVNSASQGLFAKIYFDNGVKKISRIAPRTNLEPELKKRPNIVYLIGNGNKQIILREARGKKADALDIKKMRFLFERKYREDINPKNIFSQRNEINKKDVCLIPEPSLILALEQIYKEGIAPRITPNLKILGKEENHIWYLRNFLPSVRDSPFNMDIAMTYSGTLRGLGLMDVMDFNEAHYCLDQKGEIVNIDPDFFCFTPHGGIIDNRDWVEFKDILNKIEKHHKISSNENKKRRKVYREIKKRMKGSTILDYFPENISSSPIFKNLSL